MPSTDTSSPLYPPIAVIGMACRFPGAQDCDTFWDMIKNGKSSIQDVPTNRWPWHSWFGQENMPFLNRGGFIQDVDKFDCGFFGISPREAGCIDPQHRIAIETVYKAIEDAGYKMSHFNGQNVGVFFGISTYDFAMRTLDDTTQIDAYSAVGISDCILPNRISYMFNFTGPSEPIDTACSSSLLAIHRAATSLASGESSIALVGGVNLLLHPFVTISFGKGGMLSPDGQCKSFDKDANGYVRSEGVGCIVLKPLSRAIEDHDQIYGIIKGSAVNHGGHARTLTSPNVYAQARVIKSALKNAAVSPKEIGYIEAHGTGTPLGDPIEILGLLKAFNTKDITSKTTETIPQCCIGTVKTNIGHLEAAAGIAGMIKLLLSMKHKILPALANFNTLNPKIKLESTSFYLGTKNEYWKRLQNENGQEIPRKAGISSFGFGGVNVHIVVEEGLEQKETKSSDYQIVILSAKSEKRLQIYAKNLLEFILKHRHSISLQNIAYTLQNGREEMPIRLCCIVNSVEDVIAHLETFTNKAPDKNFFWDSSKPSEKLAPLIQIASAWIEGKHVDWTSHFTGENHARISLPTYPFEQEPLWFTQSNHTKEYLPMSQSLDTNPTHLDRELAIQDIKSILGKILFMDPSKINSEEKYSDMGLDSVLGLEFCAALSTKFQLKIQTSLVYDYPNIVSLVDYIHSQKIPKAIVPPVLKKTETIAQTEPHSSPLPIAVIGMSGRFPGANTVDEFWNNLISGQSSISEAPVSRWGSDYFDANPETPNKSYCKWGGFLKDIDTFDAKFFNISSREAESMDPQQRLFLEESWKALENAGYDPYALSQKKCGVFVGVSTGDYGRPESLGAHDLFGQLSAMLPARVSYALDLKGPAIAIDTACSSSLVAIHQASESIRNGECDIALAGGVNIMCTPRGMVMMSKAGMLSPTGTCYTFDTRANGMVAGEAIGVVVLKRLDKALQDRDHIYGVIRGSGVNQDGATNGITAPSSRSQTELEQDVFQKSHINPETLSYIEAHGTGTTLGDPIEIEALTNAFRTYTNHKEFCAIGSVKTNIGHTLTAAGISGFIKLLLCLKHKKLVPSLNFNTENDQIDFKNSPFYVNTTTKEWVNPGKKIGAISSFSASGTNAFMIMEEPPSASLKRTPHHNEETIIVLSGKNKEQIKSYANRLAIYINAHPELHLTDIAYTLQVGRQAMDVRLAFIVKNTHELMEALNKITKESPIPSLQQGTRSEKSAQVHLFEEDPFLKEVIHKWASHGMLARLIELWVNGVEIGWEMLPQNQQAFRVALPTYEFEKKSYWVLQHHTPPQQPTPPTPIPTRIKLSEISDIPITPSEPPLIGKVKLKQLELLVSSPDPIAPLNHTIQDQLRIILSEVLMEETLQINDTDRFQDMGMDSILGVEFCRRVNDTFNISIPASDIYHYPTLLTLSSYIKKTQLPEKNSPKFAPLSKNMSHDPLFLIHPGEGQGHMYRHLADHLPNHSIYAVDNPRFFTPEDPFTSLEEMAEAYIQALKLIRPKGPYKLGGFSFGAVVALEMARQIEKQGESIAYLLLMDPPNITRLNLDYSHIHQTGDYIAKQLFNTGVSEENIRFLKAQIINSFKIMTVYETSKPSPMYHGNTVLIETAQMDSWIEQSNNPYLHARFDKTNKMWRDQFSSVSHFIVPGTHFSLFENTTHLKSLADTISLALHTTNGELRDSIV